MITKYASYSVPDVRSASSTVGYPDVNITYSNPADLVGKVPAAASKSSAAVKNVTAAVVAFVGVSAPSISTQAPSYYWAPISRQSSSKKSSDAIRAELYDAEDLARMRHQYQRLESAVDKLSELHEMDALYLENSVAQEGKCFLQFLDNVRVFPPKIFSHGGDTLVFEWEGARGTRYLTYEDGVARVRDDGPDSEFANASELDVYKEEDLSRLVQALGGYQWRVKYSSSKI